MRWAISIDEPQQRSTQNHIRNPNIAPHLHLGVASSLRICESGILVAFLTSKNCLRVQRLFHSLSQSIDSAWDLDSGKRADCCWRGVRKSLGELRVASPVPTPARLSAQTHTLFPKSSMVSRTLSASLTRLLRTASRNSVRSKPSLTTALGLLNTLTAATAENVRDSDQPLPNHPNDYPFKWPYRRDRVSPPCSNRYSRCLDRCWFQGGDRCNQWNRSLPRAYGLQGYRPSFPTRSGA